MPKANWSPTADPDCGVWGGGETPSHYYVRRSIDPDAFRKLWHKADAIGGDLGQVGANMASSPVPLALRRATNDAATTTHSSYPRSHRLQVGDLSEVPPLDARSALLASALDSAPVSLLAWLLQRQASSQAWGGATASLLWTALGVWLWVCAQVYSASAAGTVGLSVVGGALVETESQVGVSQG